MTCVQTLTNILEGILKPENLSNKAEQGLFEMYFVFAAIWAFGGALVDKDGISYRRNFDKWWKQTWTTVKLPGDAMELGSRGALRGPAGRHA
jgi:dynein heavy chain